MPVHRYAFQSRHNRDDLVDELVQEFGKGAYPPVASQDSPDIYIETKNEDTEFEAVHVCVIWTRWGDVPEVQRPGIILDAINKAKLDLGRIAVAMGLTPNEAQTLGVEPGTQ